MIKFDLIQPTEENSYRCFSDELENDDCVFFHITEKENFDSIVQDGFKSKFEQTGKESDTRLVYYANNSNICWPYYKKDKENVIFVVKFLVQNLKECYKTPVDIGIANIQLEILGYVVIPKGFKYD